MMKYLAIIPARFESNRFPGKLLHPLMGKPILSWVIDYVKKVYFFNDIVVATEDEKIVDFVTTNHPDIRIFINKKPVTCGSQRALEVSKTLSNYDIYVTVPSDEPLINYEEINKLAKYLDYEFKEDILTLYTKFFCYDDLKSNLSCKIVTDKENNILYFSRSIIPISKDGIISSLEEYKKHVALMFFNASFLRKKGDLLWGDWKSKIETIEGLEQNRFLDFGAKIKAAEIKHDYFGVDQEWQLNILEHRYQK